LSIFSLGLIVIAFLLRTLLPEGSLPAVLPYLFILFFVVTLAVHWIVLKISELKPARFVSYFMLATFGKLVIYFIAVLVYVFTRKEQVLPFILSFFILYIFYTVFEVISILGQTRDPDKSK
jgi:apolipoprotein N-acyltransferase